MRRFILSFICLFIGFYLCGQSDRFKLTLLDTTHRFGHSSVSSTLRVSKNDRYAAFQVNGVLYLIDPGKGVIKIAGENNGADFQGLAWYRDELYYVAESKLGNRTLHKYNLLKDEISAVVELDPTLNYRIRVTKDDEEGILLILANPSSNIIFRIGASNSVPEKITLERGYLVLSSVAVSGSSILYKVDRNIIKQNLLTSEKDIIYTVSSGSGGSALLDDFYLFVDSQEGIRLLSFNLETGDISILDNLLTTFFEGENTSYAKIDNSLYYNKRSDEGFSIRVTDGTLDGTRTVSSRFLIEFGRGNGTVAQAKDELFVFRGLTLYRMKGDVGSDIFIDAPNSWINQMDYSDGVLYGITNNGVPSVVALCVNGLVEYPLKSDPLYYETIDDSHKTGTMLYAYDGGFYFFTYSELGNSYLYKLERLESPVDRHEHIVHASFFVDDFANSRKDTGEGLPGISLNMPSQNIKAFSDINGAVKVSVDNAYREVFLGDAVCFDILERKDRIVVDSCFGYTIREIDFVFAAKENGDGLLNQDIHSGSARCNSTVSHTLIVSNAGCQPSTRGELKVKLDDRYSNIRSDSNFVFKEGGIAFKVPAIKPNHSYQVVVSAKTPTEDFAGDELTIQSIFDNQIDGGIEPDTLNEKVILTCAVDPNDKLVSPDRTEEAGAPYILTSEELNYTVRFQNTGNDTAFKVRIEDQLSDNLNWNTLRPIGASHSNQIRLNTSTGLLEVTFEDIMLPDSTTDLISSQGFVTFGIFPQTDIRNGTLIGNTADIYFDSNRPITTNTTVSIIVNAFDADGDGFEFWRDCNDGDPSVNPSEEEIPNNELDENCDGLIEIIDADGDGFNSDEDCNDGDAIINPDAIEIVNNDIDENCDGLIEMIDADMDGYNSHEDCDDNNANVNPGEAEVPNNDVDENCDGLVEVIDEDRDGYNSAEDCNDGDAAINPDAIEIVNNDIDENCDGLIELIDADMDGYNSDEDCDDDEATINPGEAEVPNNDVDENCDGLVEVIDADGDAFNSDEDCNDSDATINPDAVEIVNNDIDEDCDGLIELIDADMDGYNSDEDCDDQDATINPGEAEVPNNDVDENCDGLVEVIDADGDGFNSAEDCNDGDATINPDAVEVVNNDIDENCDGLIELIDADMDGYNSDEDCNDSDATINPGAEEVPNNEVDEDCDGNADMTTAVSDLGLAEQVLLYPNPVMHTLNVHSELTLTGAFKILNAMGQIVVDQSAGNTPIDVHSLDKGVYILQLAIAQGHTVINKRFVVL